MAQESWRVAIDPLTVSSVQRLDYVSTSAHGRTVMSATVLTPRLPYLGHGRRPLVAVAPGTQGLADRCAPSQQMRNGLEYEYPLVAAFLLQGMAVVVPDYEGMARPGDAPYLDARSEGPAVLDAMRAARRMDRAPVTGDSPVLLSGYSQGGSAVAAALERAPSYAPDVRITAAHVGAVVADPLTLTQEHDGHSINVGYLLAGLMTSDPSLHLERVLTPAGRAEIAALRDTCVTDPGRADWDSRDFTVGRVPLVRILQRPDVARVLARRGLGRGTPRVPVLMTHSPHDDTVPYESARRLAQGWCARGARVSWQDLTPIPSHIVNYVPASVTAVIWLRARLAGLPAPDHCRGV